MARQHEKAKPDLAYLIRTKISPFRISIKSLQAQFNRNNDEPFEWTSKGLSPIEKISMEMMAVMIERSQD